MRLSAAAGEQPVISGKLGKTERSHNIGHVTLEIGLHNVVFPCADTAFVQRVLGLAVKGKQHIIFIDFLVINAVDVTPNGRAALCRGEIFDGMERKNW